MKRKLFIAEVVILFGLVLEFIGILVIPLISNTDEMIGAKTYINIGLALVMSTAILYFTVLYLEYSKMSCFDIAYAILSCILFMSSIGLFVVSLMRKNYDELFWGMFISVLFILLLIWSIIAIKKEKSCK